MSDKDLVPIGPRKVTRVTKFDENGRISEFEQLTLEDPRAVAEAEAAAAEAEAKKAAEADSDEVWTRNRKLALGVFDGTLQELQANPNNAHAVMLTQAHYSAIRETVVAALTFATAVCDRLNKRIADLETQPKLSYRGVWKDSESYSVGSFVTSSGCLWAALTASKAVKPGTAEGVWQLCVKKGRDGKDAK